jgi:hypothetical protein
MLMPSGGCGGRRGAGIDEKVWGLLDSSLPGSALLASPGSLEDGWVIVIMLNFAHPYIPSESVMNVTAEHSGVSTLSGTPKEVQALLNGSHADRVLVLAFAQITPSSFETLAENFTNVASAMFELLLHRHDRESLEQLVEMLVPRSPPSPALLKEAVMLTQARTAVLESGDWLTAAEVAQLAELSTSNTSSQPNKWKNKGQIFAISHKGVDYFPGYGLDREAGFRPIKAMAKVIDAFQGHKSGWGMAYWFCSDNSFLGGKRPQDLLATAPERVIEAALDEVQEVAHG